MRTFARFHGVPTLRAVRAAFFATTIFALSLPLGASAALGEDPCATVPRSLVASVLGGPIVEALSQTLHQRRSCGYRTSAERPYTVITASRFASIAAANADLDAESSHVASTMLEPAVPMKGFGDRAVRVVGLLYVRKGKAVYSFGNVGETPEIVPRTDHARAGATRDAARETLARRGRWRRERRRSRGAAGSGAS